MTKETSGVLRGFIVMILISAYIIGMCYLRRLFDKFDDEGKEDDK